ncbi:hypothetical protein MNBD_ALPHA05-360 [hydrothermal vent metagenome]|uniref:Uncharacterized protein n=2 Tax=hydrothermal vent metagenome TaxID=652676 RepID=A0A3B0TMY8_9ZZZZ
MNTLFKTMAIGIIGAVTLMMASVALAAEKPAYCNIGHDHRSHNADYYDYYQQDKYYRAGPYRSPHKSSGVSLSITIGNGYSSGRRYRDGRHAERRYNDQRNYRRNNNQRRSDRGNYRRNNQRGKNHGYRGRDGRIVNRQVFDTRYQARIVLVEEAVRTRNGPRLVCTVKARGREANHVSNRRMRRIANNNCSPRARINV